MTVSARGIVGTLVVAVALAASAGCAGSCDPEGAARELAGADANDCGVARTADERDSLFRCIEAGLAAGVPVYGGWIGIGRDTQPRTYFASDGETTWMISYDSGLGGHATASFAECTAPPTRVSMPAPFGDALRCPTGSSTALCGR